MKTTLCLRTAFNGVAILLAGCQAAATVPLPTSQVTIIPIASSIPGLSGERQSLDGYFSFITPADFETDLEGKFAYISDAAEEVFISLAIIGEGEDERSAQGLLDDIFEGFEGVEIRDPETTTIDGLPGQKSDFSGVVNGGVVSGYYVMVDLGSDISFLAFGMGKVTQITDSWQQFGELNFTQLLETVDIVFAPTF